MQGDEHERPEYVTTDAVVRNYQASQPVFSGLLKEVRELSRKKPEATMSPGKVKIINRVLADLLLFLKGQPESKYLELLDNETLPQVSDGLMVMVQFETALASFYKRHHVNYRWMTEERLLAEAQDYEGDESFGGEEL